jgi:ABC-type antimicrobial peptide transport system permease subunit
MLAALEIRRRWRTLVGLALLVGVVGALVLSTLAGARRSDTALARFSAVSRSGDVALLPAFAYTPTPAQLTALRHIPDVAAFAVVRFYALRPVHGPSDNNPVAPLDTAFGTVIDRSRLVAGRRANPRSAAEVTIGEALAAQLHARVGGHLSYASYTQAQLIAHSGSPPAPAGPRVRLQIVGIVRRPDDLGDVNGAAQNVVAVTPAFTNAYFDRIGNFGALVEIRTRHGVSDVRKVTAAARAIFATSGGSSVQSSLNDTQGAQSATNVLTLALWILAGVAALAGVVTIGIVMTREISLASVDHETLRSLGLTRRQRVLLSGPGGLLVAVGGAFLGAIGAVAASPLFPFGVARRADPNVGVHLDWVVLAPGIVAISAVVLAIAFVAAFRSTRHLGLDATAEPRQRASTVVEAAGRAGLAPTVTNGLRMALERGRGRTAVPVRSAYLGAVFGVLGVTAVLVFASSLDHLGATPRLYGSTWDFEAADTNFTDDPTACNQNDLGLTRVAGVGAVGAVCSNDLELGGRPITGWGFTPIRGTIGPEVVTGRAPRAPDEVALGATTLRALGKSLGDTVQARGPNGPVRYTIVGRAVFPILDQPQALADGAAFTGAGLARVFDSNTSSNRYLLGRFAAGADRDAVTRRIAAIPALDPPAGARVPVEINRVRHVDWLPAALAVGVAALALVAILHALVSSVRRRRRDLALLKALGFDRHQTQATIAWQATTMGVVALAIGLPVGVALGKLAWRLVASGLGVTTTAPLPVAAVLLTIPIAIAVVNVLAYIPGRTAARTPAAVALRAE